MRRIPRLNLWFLFVRLMFVCLFLRFFTLSRAFFCVASFFVIIVVYFILSYPEHIVSNCENGNSRKPLISPFDHETAHLSRLRDTNKFQITHNSNLSKFKLCFETQSKGFAWKKILEISQVEVEVEEEILRIYLQNVVEYVCVTEVALENRLKCFNQSWSCYFAIRLNFMVDNN